LLCTKKKTKIFHGTQFWRIAFFEKKTGSFVARWDNKTRKDRMLVDDVDMLWQVMGTVTGRGLL
jgi:hypothetical protein